MVIVCGEGIVDEQGQELGSETASTDPAGNKVLSGAAEALRQILIDRLGDSYFTSKRRNESARAAIFTRKVGHTQRGGRPIYFDRFYGAQLGGHAVDLLLEGHVNGVAILQWTASAASTSTASTANDFRDRYGLIHARQVHPSFYDRERCGLSDVGVDYLLPIFSERHRRRRHGGRPPDPLPHRQPDPAVPLRQRRYQQADLLPGLSEGPCLAPNPFDRGRHQGAAD